MTWHLTVCLIPQEAHLYLKDCVTVSESDPVWVTALDAEAARLRDVRLADTYHAVAVLHHTLNLKYGLAPAAILIFTVLSTE